MGWFSRKRHELCPAYLLALFCSVLQTTVPLRVSLSRHCKWAELYFQYFLVIIYFCIPGKGARCFQLAFTIIYLRSALGEALTWELTNSIYSANYLINWEKQRLLSDLFWLFLGLFVLGFLYFFFLLLWFIFLRCPDQAWFCFVFGANITPAHWDLSVLWWLSITFTGTPGRELRRSHIQVFGTFVPRHNWTNCKLAKKADWVSFLSMVQFAFLKAFIFSEHTLSFPTLAPSFQFQRSGLAHSHSG